MRLIDCAPAEPACHLAFVCGLCAAAPAVGRALSCDAGYMRRV